MRCHRRNRHFAAMTRHVRVRDREQVEVIDMGITVGALTGPGAAQQSQIARARAAIR
jgi:hypothetical protein